MSAPAQGPAPTLDVVIPPALGGTRLDRAVALLGGLSRRAVADLVSAGAVDLDGRAAPTRATPVRPGQRLVVRLPVPGPAGPEPDPGVRFTVVHEDEALVVVDKPAGLVVHRGAGHSGGTLVDGLVARYPDLVVSAAGGELGDPARPGIVHRLDKGTSGLLVVARRPDAYRSLSRQLSTHSAGRAYVALVVGALPDEEGVVDAPIGRSTRRRTAMAVRAGGRPARTGYVVRERFATPVVATLLDARLDTGRTHQIRVHLAAIGHPVVGDDRYGAGAARPPELVGGLAAGRLFLHAGELTVEHPDTAERVTWRAPLPPDLDAVLAVLGR